MGARRSSNFWWALGIGLASMIFFLTGFSSCFNRPLFFIIHAENIQSFPQGILMIFYGCCGLLLSFYLGSAFFFGVGSGFNEFNKRYGYIRIFRWGFPGKLRRLDLYYPWEEVLGISIELQERFYTQYAIYLQIRGKVEIPLTYRGDPMSFEEIEKQASALAKFLHVNLNIKK